MTFSFFDCSIRIKAQVICWLQSVPVTWTLRGFEKALVKCHGVSIASQHTFLALPSRFLMNYSVTRKPLRQTRWDKQLTWLSCLEVNLLGPLLFEFLVSNSFAVYVLQIQQVPCTTLPPSWQVCKVVADTDDVGQTWSATMNLHMSRVPVNIAVIKKSVCTGKTPMRLKKPVEPTVSCALLPVKPSFSWLQPYYRKRNVHKRRSYNRFAYAAGTSSYNTTSPCGNEFEIGRSKN